MMRPEGIKPMRNVRLRDSRVNSIMESVFETAHPALYRGAKRVGVRVRQPRARDSRDMERTGYGRDGRCTISLARGAEER